MTTQSIAVETLRPTQIALGGKLVKVKRKGLREHEKKPQELVDYILSNPLRVVLGPRKLTYVIDHHHLARALLEEGFDTAPVLVMADLSNLAMPEFWKQMEGQGWLYPYDAKGKKRPISAIPKKIEKMEDDPYRSLAGFVRLGGGFVKTSTPYAEFAWANYYRKHIPAKLLKKNFENALAWAMRLAASADAVALPGYVAKVVPNEKNKRDDQ